MALSRWSARSPTASAPQAFQPRRLDDLDPVAVGVLDEGNVIHLALLRSLHVDHLVLIEPADRRVEVGHREADVTEALRLRVAIVVREPSVGFRHICFSVPDLDAAIRWFDENQVVYVKRPEQGKMKDVAFIRDPDGYWIEIVEAARLKALGR